MGSFLLDIPPETIPWLHFHLPIPFQEVLPPERVDKKLDIPQDASGDLFGDFLLCFVHFFYNQNMGVFEHVGYAGIPWYTSNSGNLIRNKLV